MQTHAKLTLAALASLAMLSACDNRADDRTIGQRVDSAAERVEQQAADARDATARVADTAGDKARDMTITAAVNGELAKDQTLSALRIDVDTVDGRVTLRGTAPDGTSRDRATALANSVSGVLAVDNQLTVSR
jgi:hyperosmotically inducible periplasmic protein